MNLPTYDQFIEPLLRYLAAKPQGSSAKDAHEAVAAMLVLSNEQKKEMLSSGQLVYKNRVGWAHDRLKRAGFSKSEKRGFWKITPEGIAFEKQNPSPFSEALISHLALAFIDTKLKPEGLHASEIAGSVSEPVILASSGSPDDQLEEALKEIRESVADELLELLHQVAPIRFESIVLDVLHRLGYGASREDLQRVGGSGDGGIDGVIALDKLGLEKVYVQAKRWQGSVGRPEIQAFYGALAGQKAKKGVFITTSTFTSQSIEFAKSVEGIVLVDGRKLVHLMMDHEIGVTSRKIHVPKLDSDYFEDQ